VLSRVRPSQHEELTLGRGPRRCGRGSWPCSPGSSRAAVRA
jgi:hypothetical protein